MDIKTASKFCVPFGRHRGKPLEAVLMADPSYLIWLKRKAELRDGPFKIAFEAFMADPDIQTELDNRLMDEKAARQNWR